MEGGAETAAFFSEVQQFEHFFSDALAIGGKLFGRAVEDPEIHRQAVAGFHQVEMKEIRILRVIPALELCENRGCKIAVVAKIKPAISFEPRSSAKTADDIKVGPHIKKEGGSA
jgi:hypothetical protein